MVGKKFTIRSRAVIVKEGKLLVVHHTHDPSFAALPGGHLEWGEDVVTCLRREIVEELGVEPEVGRLLFINTYIEKEKTQPMEFFFEVLNVAAYEDVSSLERSHAFELASVEWITPEDDVRLLPIGFAQYFKTGDVFSDEVRYIQS